MRKKILIPTICVTVAVIAIAVTVVIFITHKNKTAETKSSYVGTFVSLGWYSEDLALINSNNVIYVSDYSTGTCVALCSQPNCEHKKLDEDPDSTCTAIPPEEFSLGNAYIYNDKLYEIFYKVNTFEIYTANKDGTSRQKIFSTDEYSFESAALVCEDKLIISASYMNAEDSGEVKITYYLLSYDLSDNSLEVVMDFSDCSDIYFWSIYMYDDTVYCWLSLDDTWGLYSCKNGKLNEVYSGEYTGVGSFGGSGCYIPIRKSQDSDECTEIDMYDFTDNTVKKVCDVSGYVSIFPSDDGVYYYSDSSADGDFDSDNVRTIYYCDGENTTQCLQSTDDLKWTIDCIAGDKIILIQASNTGEWTNDETRICVSKDELIGSELENAVVIESPSEE